MSERAIDDTVARSGRATGLLGRVKASVQAQLQDQSLRWRLWAPVALGAGCAIYFSLKIEPPLWTLVAPAILTFGVWIVARRAGARRIVTLPLMLLACLAIGLAASGLRTARVAGPVAPALTEPTTMAAWVLDVDSPGERGARVVVAPVWIKGLPPEATPIRLRATVRGAPPRPGEAVRLFGILNPPPPPAGPGAYDFGRNAYFAGLGGVVFSLGETRGATLDPPPWRLRLIMRVNALRFALAERIVARLGARTGGVAAAMVTGHETWIARDDLDAMRDSGLAHILSISGLHMAVVGGFVFFLARLIVAAVPWLALRLPGKKVAAWAGLLAVWTYLVISGSPPPAERAAVTASIAFLAILLDRSAITMQALAVAALIVLVTQPEAIVTPGFQMSFAATAALVALAEAWPRRIREISTPLPIALIQRAGRWSFAACVASLVAGLATGPFAMQHFNRTAVYGLLANLATSPLADFIMMPSLALGAALEPLGLGAPFLWLAGRSIDLMLGIGHWTAGLPGAIRTVASAPDIALPVAFLGILIICLWRGWLRWFGLPLALAVMLWPRAASPDVWIGEGGTNAAFRRGSDVVIVRDGVRQFATDLWSRRRGLTPIERREDDWVCTRFSCAPASASAGPLALWWGRRAPSATDLAGLCRNAEVVSIRAVVAHVPAECRRRLVLDAVDLKQGGAVELWRGDAGAWRALWTEPLRGDRPWTRRSSLDLSDSGE